MADDRLVRVLEDRPLGFGTQGSGSTLFTSLGYVASIPGQLAHIDRIAQERVEHLTAIVYSPCACSTPIAAPTAQLYRVGQAAARDTGANHVAQRCSYPLGGGRRVQVRGPVLDGSTIHRVPFLDIDILF